MDETPTAGSKNLVTSGGVAEGTSIKSLFTPDKLNTDHYLPESKTEDSNFISVLLIVEEGMRFSLKLNGTSNYDSYATYGANKIKIRDAKNYNDVLLIEEGERYLILNQKISIYSNYKALFLNSLEEVLKLCSTVVPLNESVNALSTEVSSISAEVSSISADVSGISTTVNELDSSVSNLSVEVASLSEQLIEIGTTENDTFDITVSESAEIPEGAAALSNESSIVESGTYRAS